MCTPQLRNSFKEAGRVLCLVLFVSVAVVVWSGWFLHVYACVACKHRAYVCIHTGTHTEAEVGPGSIPTLGVEVFELTDLIGLSSVPVRVPSVCLFSAGIIRGPMLPGSQRLDGW